MEIEKINYKKIEKEFLIKSLIEDQYVIPSKKELKFVHIQIESAMLTGNYLVARNSFIVSIFYAPEETFDFIKKKGLFRYSKYINKKCIVKELAIELIGICKKFKNCSEKRITYLTSIINYATVLDSFNAIEKHIIQQFKIFDKIYSDKSIIKTLLAATDFLFLSNHYPKEHNNLTSISNRTKENVSSAVSFLIYLYTERIKKSNINISLIHEKYISGGEIDKLIIPACYFLDFKEFEIMIDHFDYTCEKTDNYLYVKPTFEDFEKSIRAGYIRTEIQLLNDRINAFDDAISLEEFADKINEQQEFKFFKLTETFNYPRYRLEFPEPVLDIIIEKFIKPDNLFKEELKYLSQIFKEQLLDINDLEKIKLKGDLTLYDFIKIRRVFLLLYTMFAKEIFKIEKVDNDTLLRSLIPLYTSDQFFQFIEKIVPNNKVHSFLDIICWEPGLEMIFDLQYHPILNFDDSFLVPLSILANSNSIRNLFASEYKQSNGGLLNSGESLVKQLSSSLNKISIPSYTETEIGNTDIDVFIIYEDTLFVFECKHTLHPVSSFDLRTTYDYIKKAERQLDKINQSFENGSLLKIIARKHNVNTIKVNRIMSCIVLSNRLFNGNIFKYPVRNINEIENMLTTGIMRTEFGTFNVWQSKSLTLEFMLDYFSLTNKLTTQLMAALSKHTLTYEFAEPKILFDSYYLNRETAIPKLKKFTEDLEEIITE